MNHRPPHRTAHRRLIVTIAMLAAIAMNFLPQAIPGVDVPTALAHNLNADAVYIYFDPDTQTYLDGLIATNQRPVGTPLLQPGDELGLIIKAVPLDGTTTGVGGYTTFYVPNGVQVVDAAYLMPGDLNADGITGYDKVPMKGQAQMPIVGAGGGPTVSLVGISRGPNILGVTSPIVNASNVPLGTVVGVYGDTGIFYSTAPETAFGTYSGGSLTNNSGDTVGLRTILGATLNKWDAWQMAGYGIKGTTNPAYPSAAIIDSNQRGYAPWGLANVVAGPQSGYAWEFDLEAYKTCTGGSTAPNAACINTATSQIGPWQRIKYPGSQISDDPPGGSPNPPYAEPYTRGTDASNVGFDLTAGDLPQTVSQTDGASPNAIRWGYGQQTQNRPEYMWVKIRVFDNTAILDPTGCPKWTLDTFGGDAGGDSGGKDHIWRYYDPNSVTLNGCLAIGKPATRELVKVGDNYQYKVKLYNAGNKDYSTVQIQDTLPSGVTYISAVPAPSSVSLPNLTWTVSPFLRSQMFEATVTVKASGSGALTNIVCAAGTPALGGPVENSCGKDITVSGAQPLLRTGKSVTPTSVAPGGTVRYTITITNVGSGPSGSPVVLTEYLPAGFTYTSTPPVATTVNGASVTATVGGTPAQPTFSVPAAIQAGQSLVLSFSALVSPSITAANYCNSYRVSEGGINQVTGALACVDVGGGTIGDTVYRDWDGDGAQDPEDEGLPGMTVNLYAGVCGPSGGVIQTQTTDANGFYQFTGLTAGDYCVDPVGPAGYSLTQGSDPTTVTLAQSEKRLDVDFGYQPGGAGSIGDLVFEDKGNDGAFNGADVGIDNVTVNLYEDSNGNGLIDAGDALIGTTQTSGGGAYSFTGLAEGLNYIVDVDQADPDLNTYFGGSPYVLSTADPQAVANLTGAYLNADFGFYEVVPGSIGDLVWYDIDGDGAVDSGEAGLANVTVRLYQDANGNGVVDPGETLLAKTETDAAGNYSFTNLPAGDYVVVVDESDSDIPTSLSASRNPIAVTLGVAENKTDVDFPFVQSLSKTVDKTSAAAGEQLTYTLYPRYFGENLLAGLVVNDPIPAGTTYVAASIDPGAPSGEALDDDDPPDTVIDRVAWDLGSNAPGDPGYSGGTAMCPATQTIIASKDTYIDSGDIDANFGAATTIGIDSNDIFHGLAEFTLPTLPSGAILDKAELLLTVAGGQDADRTVSVRKLLTGPWTEGTSNNTCTSGGNGAAWQGPNCTDTWAAGAFSASDYGAQLGATIAPAVDEATYATVVTSAVEDWYATPASNYGLALIANGSDTGTVTFHARTVSGKEPRLKLTYRAPTSGGCTGTTNLTDVADTMINQDNPTSFSGTATSVKISAETNKKKHVLLNFDVSGIPVGATVNAATLKINVKSAKSNITSEIHRLTTAWTEGTGNTDGAIWNDPNGTGTAGTWAAGAFSASDYNATVVGAITPSSNGWKPADVKSLVEGWNNATFPNYGLVLLSTGTNKNAEYRTREDNSNPSLDPIIEVKWSIPPSDPTRVNTLSASPKLVVEGDVITVKMTLENNTASDVTGVSPGSLTVAGDYACATLTGPSPASQDVPANGTATFTWSCTTDTAPTLPGSIYFSASASAGGGGGGGTGYADLVYSSQNTTNANNALGAPDAAVARIKASTPNSLVLDLGSTLPQNTVVTLRMKRFLDGGSAAPVADVDSGTDGATFTSLTTFSGLTDSLADYSYTITQAGGARYLRVRARAGGGNANDQNIDVDAASFTGGSGGGTSWAASTSETIRVTPPLTFKVTVNNPPGVPVANNQAQAELSFPATLGSVCYVMADGFDTNDTDYLRQVDRLTGAVTPASPAASGTQSVEAMAWSPDFNTLYAVNGNQLGTLNISTGAFTARPNPIASTTLPLRGEFGNITVADVDGISIDPATGAMYGVHRREGTNTQLDVLIKIDTITGKAIQNAFGAGVDYIKIRTDLLATPLYEVDDISFDPVSGSLYAIANGTASSFSVGDRLVTLDKSTGAVTDIARITKSTGGDLDDVEGLSFYGDGGLYATTGYHAATGDTNKLWELNKDTAVATETAVLGTQTTYNDYEAVACQGGALSTDVVPSNEVQTGFTASIGDFVWSDVDGDGVQDAGEPGLAGVEVCATPTGGGAAVCDTTDIDGNYRIYGLTNGASYDVTLTPATIPTGYGPTTPTTLTRTATTAGVNDADFGLRPPGTASIGDYVWLDADNDGVQDPSENGLPGVTVNLYIDQNNDGVIDGGDTLLQTTTTDANGLYQFLYLHPDDYLVQVDTASSVTSPYDGTTTIAAAMAPTTGTTNPRDVTITTVGQAITDADFGYNWTGSIGDTVWFDDDLDQVVDGSETRIPDAFVLLYFDADNNGLIEGPEWSPIAFTTTDANGNYLLDNLPPGNYLVDVYEDSITTDGDRDIVPTTPDVRDVDLDPNEDDLTADFGYYIGAHVEGNVFWDEDRNGILDASERDAAHLLENVTVNIVCLGPDGVAGGGDDFSGSMDTGAGGQPDGHFKFIVPPGPCTLTYDQPDIPTQFGDRTTPVSYDFTAIGGDDWHPSFDFGVDHSSEIGDTVFADADGNGQQDGGEPGLADVTVWLFRDVDSSGDLSAGDVFLAADLTDSLGQYLFEGLADGEYVVATNISTLPGDYVQTADPDESPPACVTCDSQGAATISGGASDLTVDFGYQYQPGGIVQDVYTLAGYVWEDTDGDGVKDAGEPVIPGVDVLVDCGAAGAFLVTTTAQTVGGNWSVSASLLDGTTCTITVDETTLPSTAYYQTGDPSEPAPPACTVCDAQSQVTVTGGANPPLQNFGYDQLVGSISGLVCDGDGDGLCDDPGDTPLANVTVDLRCVGNDDILGTADDILDSTVTDGSGAYSFSDLPPGLCQISKTNPPNYTSLADADGGNPDNITLTLDFGPDGLPNTGDDRMAATDQDFEVQSTASGSIGDLVWVDDGDGVQEPGELGIYDVPVCLYQDNAPLGVLGAEDVLLPPCQTTDLLGNYLFSNLPAGNYLAQVDTSSPALAGLGQSWPDASGIIPVALGAGQADLSADFGFSYSTAIQVVSFDSALAADASAVELSWQVLLNGAATPGFHVWRAQAGAERQQLTTSPLAAVSSNGQVASYRYTDASIAAGRVYWYWLQGDEGQFYGPWRVRAGAWLFLPSISSR